MDTVDQVEFMDVERFFEDSNERRYPKTNKRKHRDKKQKSAPAQVEKLQLREITPKTSTQNKVFESYGFGNNLVLHGTAGTGKTFISLYLALDEVLNNKTHSNIKIIRSAVPSRDVGFLPGKLNEKIEVYEAPYSEICTELLGKSNAYDTLKNREQLQFVSTSFLRGVTFRDSVVIIDEIQNMTFQEIDTIMTRIGDNCRVLLCGDFKQSDHIKTNDKNDVGRFLNVLKKVRGMDFIEFNVGDIVRSGFVRQWILACEAHA